jgi:hypothetical protein
MDDKDEESPQRNEKSMETNGNFGSWKYTICIVTNSLDGVNNNNTREERPINSKRSPQKLSRPKHPESGVYLHGYMLTHTYV